MAQTTHSLSSAKVGTLCARRLPSGLRPWLRTSWTKTSKRSMKCDQKGKQASAENPLPWQKTMRGPSGSPWRRTKSSAPSGARTSKTASGSGSVQRGNSIAPSPSPTPVILQSLRYTRFDLPPVRGRLKAQSSDTSADAPVRRFTASATAAARSGAASLPSASSTARGSR